MKYTLALISALLLCSCSPWSYQRTSDKSTVLGKSLNALSIKVDRATARFALPKGFSAVSCVDEPLEWNFSITSKESKVELSVSLDQVAKDTPILERYQSYLNVVNSLYDPKVEMVPAAPVKLADSRMVTPYRYFSAYWKQRLVVIVADGLYTTTYEFYFLSQDELEKNYPFVRQVMGSASLTLR